MEPQAVMDAITNATQQHCRYVNVKTVGIIQPSDAKIICRLALDVLALAREVARLNEQIRMMDH